jgi:hypothetical protein
MTIQFHGKGILKGPQPFFFFYCFIDVPTNQSTMILSKQYSEYSDLNVFDNSVDTPDMISKCIHFVTADMTKVFISFHPELNIDRLELYFLLYYIFSLCLFNFFTFFSFYYTH